MDVLYRSMPVSANQQQLRFITIDSTSTPQLLHCTLDSFSLLDTSPQYNDYIADGNVGGQSPTAVLQAWLDYTQVDKPPGSSIQLPTFPLEPCHRFRWGDYVALSYVWGNTSETTNIDLNGIETPITKNLAEALHCLRMTGQFGSRLRLWVDALCINQRNFAERGEQVAAMRSFYSRAWSVVGFLGREQDGSDDALQLISTLAQIRDDEAKCEELRDRLLKQIVDQKPGSWLALHRLVMRPYWGRLWITQELALGGDRTVVCCGTRAVSWQDFCRGIGVIHLYLWVARHEGLRRDISESTLNLDIRRWEASRRLDHVWKDLHQMTEVQEAQSTAASFTRLLEIANDCECTDARDKVYGMLGIMDTRLAAAVVLDYTAAPAEVFTQVAQAYIDVYRSLDILRDSNSWGPAGAPSWVPDWTWPGRGRDGRPDDLFQPETSDVSTERFPYCADRGLLFVPPRCEGRWLQSRAILFDYVDGLGCNPEAGYTRITQSTHLDSAYGGADHTARQLGVALYASRRRANDHSSALLYLPHTMDEAREKFTNLGWSFFVQDLFHYHRWIDWLKSNAELLVGGVRLQEYFSDEIPKEADVEDFKSAYQAWVRTALAGTRRLVTTTAGRVGWVMCARGTVPEVEITKGDVFAILPGCSTPILLHLDRETGMYQVMGEAYVHGVMDGELAALLDTGRYELQTIRIC